MIGLRLNHVPLFIVCGAIAACGGGRDEGAASADASIQDAGAAANSDDGGGKAGGEGGRVTCGGNECILPESVCCPWLNGGTCAARGTAGCEPIECDDTADCPAGQMCCYQFNHGCSLSASCQTTCVGGAVRVQACKSDSECASGSCTLRRCGGLDAATCEPDPASCCR
jgi:hypothetical protein